MTNKKNILTIVQTRMSSSRLPGKVMLDLCGAPVIARMIERVKLSSLSDYVVVATTTDDIDEVICNTCVDYGIDFYRGNPKDLLERHLNCAKHYDADIILKIPSDCPLIDPTIIDKCIELLLEGDFDYVSNIHSHSFPDGQDVEVFKLNVLEEAYIKAITTEEREHTTPYIWSRSDKFSCCELESPYEKRSFYKYRLTLDYIQDYWLISDIYRNLKSKGNFSLNEIIRYLDLNPKKRMINKKYHGNAWYNCKNK